MMKKFQIFRLSLRWNMFVICYFSNKFSKIAKRWGIYAYELYWKL